MFSHLRYHTCHGWLSSLTVILYTTNVAADCIQLQLLCYHCVQLLFLWYYRVQQLDHILVHNKRDSRLRHDPQQRGAEPSIETRNAFTLPRQRNHLSQVSCQVQSFQNVRMQLEGSCRSSTLQQSYRHGCKPSHFHVSATTWAEVVSMVAVLQNIWITVSSMWAEA